MYRFGTCTLLVGMLASPASGNDTAAGLVGGDLSFKNLQGVEMQEEVLVISPGQVRVQYTFFNKTDKVIESHVAFPISFYDGGDLNFDSKKNNPNSFSVKFDGKDVPFETRKIRDKEGETTTITHFWKQVFPSRKKIRIEHAYRPVFDSGVLEQMILHPPKEGDNFTKDYYEGIGKRFCLSKDEIRLVKRKKYYFDGLRYILTTAKSWDGPIKKFTLRLEKGAYPLLFLCLDLPLRKVGPKTFEATAVNYVPTAELNIGFARTGKK